MCEGFERFISLSKDHKAPVACTKLPERLKTNLRYETSPQSRPVVGNIRIGQLFLVLPDSSASPHDFRWYLVSDWKVQFCLHESISFILDSLSEKLISEICVLVWFGSLGSNTICGRSKMQIILHHRLPLNLPPLLRHFHFRCLYNSFL